MRPPLIRACCQPGQQELRTFSCHLSGRHPQTKVHLFPCTPRVLTFCFSERFTYLHHMPFFKFIKQFQLLNSDHQNVTYKNPLKEYFRNAKMASFPMYSRRKGAKYVNQKIERNLSLYLLKNLKRKAAKKRKQRFFFSVKQQWHASLSDSDLNFLLLKVVLICQKEHLSPIGPI